MSRILGIDHGERRIGLALSDPTETIATPHAVVPNTGSRAVIAELRRVCDRQEVGTIVVGLPRRTDGTEGPSAAAARAFAEDLRAALGRPVTLWDERFTTVTAERSLIEAGARRERRREIIDKIAAQIMLQSYLDSRAAPPSPDNPEDFAP